MLQGVQGQPWNERQATALQAMAQTAGHGINGRLWHKR